MKQRYRFTHRSSDGKTYYWEAVSRPPGESRVEQIRCPVDWFWKQRQDTPRNGVASTGPIM